MHPPPPSPRSQRLEEPYGQFAAGLRSAGSQVRVAKWRADGDRKPYAQEHLALKSFPTILFFPRNGLGFVKYPSEKRDPESLLAFLRSVSSQP